MARRLSDNWLLAPQCQVDTLLVRSKASPMRVVSVQLGGEVGMKLAAFPVPLQPTCMQQLQRGSSRSVHRQPQPHVLAASHLTFIHTKEFSEKAHSALATRALELDVQLSTAALSHTAKFHFTARSTGTQLSM